MVLDPQENCPASSFSYQHMVGSFDDSATVEEFAKECGVLTFEIEHVNFTTLEKLGKQGEVCNNKPDGTEDSEEEVLPGRAFPQERKPELHTDYDGSAAKWGLTHHKDSAADCRQVCLDHAKRAKEGEKKCNIWVYCPSEFGCHSPDVYQHKHQECWLKSTEKPKLNFKNGYPEWYRNSHPPALPM